jgi:hypothetical protein
VCPRGFGELDASRLAQAPARSGGFEVYHGIGVQEFTRTTPAP